MISDEKLAELSVLKIRVLELESCVILLCERCGKIWNPDGLKSWACPNCSN